MFFSESLSRVGLDFRHSLSILFEGHVVDIMTRSWNAALVLFQAQVQEQIETPTVCDTPLMLSSHSNTQQIVHDEDGTLTCEIYDIYDNYVM